MYSRKPEWKALLELLIEAGITTESDFVERVKRAETDEGRRQAEWMQERSANHP
jgi:hypothetical protein